MPKKQFILFDLDDTLLHSDNHLFSKLIQKKITCYKNNFLFGINTHRSWVDTKESYDFFKMNGPALCEGGSYIKQNQKSKPHFINGTKKINLNKFKRTIESFFINKNIPKPIFFDKEHFINKSSNNIIYINHKRITSATIYLSEKLSDYTNQLELYLNKDVYFGNLYKTTVYKNKKIMIYPRWTSKFKAMDYLIKNGNFFVHFVSNNENVPRHINSHVKIYSVRNATEEIKRKSSFIASKPRSFGILEIIEHIAGK